MPKTRNSFRDRWTNHMSTREQQRGIRRETIALAEKYGAIDGDKYILSKKQMLSVLKELDQVRKNLLRGIDQIIRERTNVPVNVAEDPLLSVVKGTGMVLENLKKYEAVLL